MPQLTLRLFGSPQIQLDEQPVQFERRKTLALLAYLAVESRGGGENRPPDKAAAAVGRATLAALLWPDASQERAAAYLRQALWDCSQALGEGWLDRAGAGLALAGGENVWLDVAAFEQALAAGQPGHPPQERVQALARAAGLYGGGFLAGFTLRDAPAFDEWQTLTAENLRLKLGQALEALTGLLGELGQPEAGITFARRWLGSDPLNEAAHRRLMQLYAAGGQRSQALQQYEICQKALMTELGVAPEAETVRLYQQIKRQEATRPAPEPVAPARPAAPPAPDRPARPVCLPAQATPFIGRQAELARLNAMLHNPDCRLVTLVGPGGSGKTRLSIQAAGQCVAPPHAAAFPHGIFFAPLAAVETLEDLLLAIAGAVRLAPATQPGQPHTAERLAGQLAGFLAEKQLLLVLDNFEQLTSHSLAIAELLAAAPGLKGLVTSRERLNLAEEWVLEVAGLAYPGRQPRASVTLYEAVQLFTHSAERAGLAQIEASEWPAIARICQLVEGNPLAVELAAAWVKLLSCQEIAQEIARDLDFLSSTRRGVPDRHSSLRAVFDHSWRMLSPAERDTLCRLSIFRGGFSRAAALAVAGASPHSLATLVDRSLVRRVSSARYDTHEMVKHYAGEKLAINPAVRAEVQARHARFFADFLAQKDRQLRRDRQIEAALALQQETQNLRLAWQWLVEGRDFRTLQALLPAFILFHEIVSIRVEGRETLQVLLEALRQALAGPSAPPPEAQSLLALTLAAMRQFSSAPTGFEQGASYQLESLAVARRLPDCREKAYAFLLNSIGPGALAAGEVLELCRQSVAIFSALDDPWDVALAHLILADVANFGGLDPALAASSYAASQEIFERLGNDWGHAVCLTGRMGLASRQGRWEEAAALGRQALEIHARLGIGLRIFDTRHSLALIAVQQGRPDEARAYLTANLDFLAETGQPRQREQYIQMIERQGLDGPWRGAGQSGRTGAPDTGA